MTHPGTVALQAGRAGIAIAAGGVSIGATGASAVILAAGAAVALAGVGIWVLRDTLTRDETAVDRPISSTHSA